MMSDLSFRVDAVRFNEMVSNAALFTPKNGVTEGNALFAVVADIFWMYASDNFVIVRDETPASFNDEKTERTFLIPVAQLKAADMWSRKVPEGPITLSFDLDELTLSAEGVEDIFFCVGDFAAEPWAALGDLVNKDSVDSGGNPDRYKTWALNPERLRNIARLKVGKDDHPIDLRQATLPGWEDVALWQFRLGPNIRGVITPMDRDKLRDRGCHLW